MSKIKWSHIVAAGDYAILLEFGKTLDPQVNRTVHQTARAVQNAAIKGVWGIVPAYTTLLIEFDPLCVEMGDVINALERLEIEGTDVPARSFEIPVCYGGELGPDLEDIAGQLGLSVEEVVTRHTAQPYQIYCIGFSPGFPLCGILPEQLRVPRRASPRTVVPAGSVAIAGAQTGIYPTESPGGWNLIGRTPTPLFFLDRDPPIFYQPGDMLQFRAVSRTEYDGLAAQAATGQNIVAEVPYAPS